MCLMNLAPSVYPSLRNPRFQNWLIIFFFCFLALKWEKWASSLLSRPVGKAQNVPQNLIHDRDLINLYIISLLEYEITNSLQRFCKNHISRKNLVLDLWSQNLQHSQNAGFFKLQYLTNKLRYEVRLEIHRNHIG